MQGYMARLGKFHFSIDTASFQQLQRASSWRWQAVNRIGRKPAQQTAGPGADEITLQGTIYPHFRGGLSQMAVLRAQANRGVSLPLVYADTQAGQFVGNYCITKLEETRTVFFADGRPRKIEFNLSLVEYGDDAGSAAAQYAELMQKNLSSLASAKLEVPVITGNSVLDKAFSDASKMSLSLFPAAGSIIGNLGAQLETVVDFAAELGSGFLPVKNAIIEGIDVATDMRNYGSSALSMLGDVPEITRIAAAAGIIDSEMARSIQSVTRSSQSIVSVFNTVTATPGQPADMVSCLRSSSRSMGSLAKLCTDTSIATQRILRDIA